MKSVGRALAITIAVAGLIGGCSDDTTGSDAGPDAGQHEAGQPDAFQSDGPLESNMGEGCQGVAQCKAGSPLCLQFDLIERLGICTRACQPDDPATTKFNEDDCPTHFACASFSSSEHYCLKICEPSLEQNPCPASSGQVCEPASTQLLTASRRAVCWFPPCQDDSDCPVLAAKTDTCVSQEDCAGVDADAFCLPALGRCARPGKCSAAGICAPHDKGNTEAQVGDPCTADFDCPGNGFCIEESTEGEGLVGVDFRNGYCSIANCVFSDTIPEYACPSGSTCNYGFPTGACYKTCDPSSETDCRGRAEDSGGDYECYAWNSSGLVAFDGLPISDAPICESAARQSCDALPAGSSCAALGPVENATDMSCRDRSTGVAKEDPRDPSGVCLDDTASGVFEAPSDAGASDASPTDGAGPSDAGVD